MSEGSNQDYQEEDITALREEYDNAKENLNQQSQTFQLFAEESQRMMRITLVFAGLLLTAITSFEIDIIGQIITSEQRVIAGSSDRLFLQVRHLGVLIVVSLLASTVTHTIGNEARAVGTVGEVDDIQEVLKYDTLPEKEYLQNRLEKYSKRIERNKGTIRVMESILGYGKSFIIFSGILITLIGYVEYIGPIPRWVPLVGGSLALGLVYYLVTKFPDEYLLKEIGEKRVIMRYLIKLHIDRKDNS